jgi:predicted NAD-dependent protein-ADP-ribosyltransferase YbiA (DUF1768 family)/ribonuclease HI
MPRSFDWGRWATLYSDASWYSSEQGGWGVWLRYNDEATPCRVIRAGPCQVANSTVAEMVAIVRGVELAVATWGDLQGLHVRSDSQGALAWAEHGARRPRGEEARELQKRLRRLVGKHKLHLRLKWVPSHQRPKDTSAWLNNAVDKAAREAARRAAPNPNPAPNPAPEAEASEFPRREGMETSGGGLPLVCIRRSRDPYGWMGNMSPYSVTFEGQEYRTTEALFQCLRLGRPVDWNVPRHANAILIQEERSPVKAKQLAYAAREFWVVEPRTPEDLDNMALCLRLKLEQHPELAEELRATGDVPIIEDVSKRLARLPADHPGRESAMFWGRSFEGGQWVGGENHLGRLWMRLREELRARALRIDP